MWMLILAAFVAGTLATFTDWLFMGVLFHDRYMRYPEVWWPGLREKGDRAAILWSCALAYVTASAVVVLCALAGANDLKAALTVAVLAWAAGPLAVVITNGLFIKIDPLITVMHCVGYLVRFLLAGIAVAVVLPAA
jgi:Protein of unknown function (DUF1761)